MNKKELREIVKKFLDKKILVIGDIMLDEYVYGTMERINPEAPVPIHKEEYTIYKLGGAANVAANIISLGGHTKLIGFIANDPEGEKIKELTKKEKIELVYNYDSITTRKRRKIAKGQQVGTRDDRENTKQKTFSPSFIEKQIDNYDLIIISDYEKGAITPDLMKRLENYKEKIIVDPKPKNKALYQGVFLITPNETEAKYMTHNDDIYEAGEQLKKELSANIIIKRGGKGMSIFNNGVRDIKTYAKEVYDEVGAGDTVTAALALSIASGANLDQAAEIANHAAGIVVGKLGTATVSSLELEKVLNHS